MHEPIDNICVEIIALSLKAALTQPAKSDAQKLLLVETQLYQHLNHCFLQLLSGQKTIHGILSDMGFIA